MVEEGGGGSVFIVGSTAEVKNGKYFGVFIQPFLGKREKKKNCLFVDTGRTFVFRMNIFQFRNVFSL